MTTAAPQLDEEAFVKAIVDGLTMPPGVQFDRVEQSLDWQGNPALRIYFTISKSLPLTNKRVGAMRAVADAVQYGVLRSSIEKWPFIHLIEVK